MAAWEDQANLDTAYCVRSEDNGLSWTEICVSPLQESQPQEKLQHFKIWLPKSEEGENHI